MRTPEPKNEYFLPSFKKDIIEHNTIPFPIIHDMIVSMAKKHHEWNYVALFLGKQLYLYFMDLKYFYIIIEK